LPRNHDSFVVGVLSDSHGQLDPRALEVFARAGVEHIIHAGDVGTSEVLIELESIAPVTVVRGNTDPHSLGMPLPERATPVLGGVRFAVVHQPADLERWALPADVLVAITGHTHRPAIRRLGPRLYVNPGSVFRPRGPEGRSVAIVTVNPTNGEVEARIVPLDTV